MSLSNGFDHSALSPREVEARDSKFHPENTPANAKPVKLAKGPDGAGFNDKGPFKDLDKEWRAKMDSGKDEELRAEASQVSLNEVANQTLKDADQDLASAKATATAAGKQYADNTKANRMKVKYIRQLLEARGKEPAARDLDLVSKT
jgi:hypothetical protein